jgi:recombination protein RecA
MKEQERRRVIRMKLARFDSDPVRPTAPPLTTGIDTLDSALGGGLPRGRMVEVFGPSCGKSTLALQIVAHTQRNGGAAGWIDADHTFDPSYAGALGVRLQDLAVVQPESAEQAMEMARRLAGSSAIDLLVVDSAAALAPALELEAGVGDQSPGLQSRVLASGLRRLAAVARRTETCVIFLNQTRTRIQPDGSETETSAGGPPLKMYAAARIALSTGEAGRVGFRVLKNRAAAAFAAGELARAPGGGFANCP